MNIPHFLRTAERFAVDNSPLILTGLGVAGTLTTALLTGRATIKATRTVDFLNGERENQGEAPLKPQEVVGQVWPLYIPPVGVCAFTVTGIILANRIGTRRAAAMAAAYAISERAFEEYRDKIVEKFGPNKERDVRDDLAQSRVDNNPVGRNEVIIASGGEVLCYCSWTGRYFRSDMDTINKAVNLVNYRIINHGYASLNDFYDHIGLAHVPSGDEIGWNSDKIMEVTFSAVISQDDRPCIAIDFHTEPVRNYYKTH